MVFNTSFVCKVLFLVASLVSASALSLGKGDLLSPVPGKIEVGRRRIVGLGLVATALLKANPGVSAEEGKLGLLSTTEVADLLHPVPTFTIVDKKGVPYMVVGSDAKVTGYFFTTYGEAARILELAKSSANKAISEAKAEGKPKEEIGTNPWSKARISSIPLDSAITLVSKSSASFGGGNFFRSKFVKRL
eukprot:scaffold6265_cov193-Cylindrotheca_fusiformis.AAC.19